MRTFRSLHLVGAAFLVLVGALGVTGGVADAADQAVGALNGGLPPENLDPPEITGTAQVGVTLQASTGAWTGTPTDFAYQWQQCDADPCTDITGATGATYTLVAADIGHEISVTVVATNVYGDSEPAGSDYTLPVEGIAPTGPQPVITGIPRVGETLTATIGPWTGEPPLVTTWGWARIESLEAQSADEIAGATSDTYTLTAEDVGMIVVVGVQISGPLGTGYGSAYTGPVFAPPSASGDTNATSTGNTITVSGSGFLPDSDVTVVLQSDPVTLGVAHTDANGNFTATFPLPAGVEAGEHTLVLTGYDAAGNPITVTQVVYIAGATGTLPVTGVDNWSLALVAFGLILLGAVTLLGRRRYVSPVT